jgi:hypothetical protein
VAARDPAAAEAEIRRLVASAGFGPLTVRPIEPSLEDVFVSVLSRQPGPG